MIIDTSAIVAILKNEPDSRGFHEVIANARFARISAASYVELQIVISRLDRGGLSKQAFLYMEKAEVTIESVTKAQADRAIRAYQVFGRGSGHPAQLNFGDCFSYALARELDEPLLFKGNDFNHTDVRIAEGSQYPDS